MRTMFLAALFLSSIVGMSSAHAQETPKTDAEILSRMAYRTSGEVPLSGAELPVSGPEFGSLKAVEMGDLKLVPVYSFVRRTEAWRPVYSGQEIRVDQLSIQAYSRKHPQVAFRMTGMFAQRNADKITPRGSLNTFGRRDLDRERKLSIGFKRTF